MARCITLTPNKTYASVENAIKAVEKKFGKDNANQPGQSGRGPLTYFIQPIRRDGETDWRYFPVFIGERACQAMVHFHFNVVA